MNVAVIGKNGGLAQALIKSLTTHHVIAYSKEEYNLSLKENVQRLSKQISKADVIVCCCGIYDQDSWDTYITNLVGPSYLLELLTIQKSTAHVIIVGSHASMWTSWPGTSMSRLVYNNSKNALENYTCGLDHSNNSSLKLSVINPSKFESPMSNYSGQPIKIIVDAIEYIMNLDVPPLVYEISSRNAS